MESHQNLIFVLNSHTISCDELNDVSPNNICWNPIYPSVPQNIILFGKRVFIEVANLKWGHSVGPIPVKLASSKKGENLDTETDMRIGKT